MDQLASHPGGIRNTLCLSLIQTDFTSNVPNNIVTENQILPTSTLVVEEKYMMLITSFVFNLRWNRLSKSQLGWRQTVLQMSSENSTGQSSILLQCNKATMGDISSLDTFRKWRFFAFHSRLALTVLYPRPPNSMLCRCCGLCVVRNRKINIAWGYGAIKCFQNARKSNFTAKSLLQHVCLPVQLCRASSLYCVKVLHNPAMMQTHSFSKVNSLCRSIMFLILHHRGNGGKLVSRAQKKVSCSQLRPTFEFLQSSSASSV